MSKSDTQKQTGFKKNAPSGADAVEFEEGARKRSGVKTGIVADPVMYQYPRPFTKGMKKATETKPGSGAVDNSADVRHTPIAPPPFLSQKGLNLKQQKWFQEMESNINRAAGITHDASVAIEAASRANLEQLRLKRVLEESMSELVKATQRVGNASIFTGYFRKKELNKVRERRNNLTEMIASAAATAKTRWEAAEKLVGQQSGFIKAAEEAAGYLNSKKGVQGLEQMQQLERLKVANSALKGDLEGANPELARNRNSANHAVMTSMSITPPSTPLQARKNSQDRGYSGRG